VVLPINKPEIIAVKKSVFTEFLIINKKEKVIV